MVRPTEASRAATDTGWQQIYLGAHSSSASPLVMGLTHQIAHSQSPLICHTTSEVCFITRGHGCMVTDETEHPFAPGDALHIEPECWHSIKTESEEVEMVYLFPSPDLPPTRTSI